MLTKMSDAMWYLSLDLNELNNYLWFIKETIFMYKYLLPVLLCEVYVHIIFNQNSQILSNPKVLALTDTNLDVSQVYASDKFCTISLVVSIY